MEKRDINEKQLQTGKLTSKLNPRPTNQPTKILQELYCFSSWTRLKSEN